jgi:predicted nucleic acid-binding protein
VGARELSVELADTSAWSNRHRDQKIAEQFGQSLVDGSVATCPPVRLELLRMTRDAAEFEARRRTLDTLRLVSVGPREWQRAEDVFFRLAELGPLHHRPVALTDLLVAAAAERAEMPVLHYDRHFELIASVTGQPVRAIAPLGSL